MSIFDPFVDAVHTVAGGITGVGSSIANGVTGVGSSIASGVTGAYNIASGGLVGAANALSQQAISTWRTTSNTASFVADSAAAAGLTVGKGVTQGADLAYSYGKIGVDYTNKGLVAAKQYVTAHACDIAVGSALSAVFVSLAADGEEEATFAPLAVACTLIEKAAISTASKAIAAFIAEPIYCIPGVADAVGHKDDFIAVITWAITKAATENPQMVVGTAGQVVAGLIIATVTSLVCEGTLPAGCPRLWTGVQGTVVNSPSTKPADVRTVWPEGYRLRIGGDPIYLVLDGKVRHIPNATTYFNLFANWDNVKVADPHTQVIGTELTDGAYLGREKGGQKVYLVCDGMKRWITSMNAFNKYNFNVNAVRELPPAQVSALPEGKAISGVVRREGEKIVIGPGLYVVLDGLARHIPNPATRDLLFADSNARTIGNQTDGIGAQISDGAHLGREESSGKVYFISDGMKRWISSPDVFNRYSFNWNTIKSLTKEEMTMATGATIV